MSITGHFVVPSHQTQLILVRRIAWQHVPVHLAARVHTQPHISGKKTACLACALFEGQDPPWTMGRGGW
jgi:hypothetical protein